MKQQFLSKTEDFLKSLRTEIDVLYMVDIDNIDLNNAYQSIYEMIESNSGFQIDIIYYNKAIAYLQENDPSLKESLIIANEMGFDVKNLNSEILASLLASENAREDFGDLKSEIDDFFIDLQSEIEEDEENEDSEEESENETNN